MHVVLTDTERREIATMPTADPEAYELFLVAVHHLRLATESDYLAARERLMRAVERDPSFSLALVTLASTFAVMAVDGYEAPAQAWPQSEHYVERALAVDPELPDAHAEAAASAFYYHWDWGEAERRWALALGRRREIQSELLAAYSLQKWARGQPEAALELARAAREVDPLSGQALVREADVLAAMGRLDDAAAAFERIARELPDDPRAYFGLAGVRLKQRRFDESLAARRQAFEIVGDRELNELFESARGAEGCREVARALAARELDALAVRESAGRYTSMLDYARAYAGLGDANEAFRCLDAAIEERAPGVVFLGVDPVWDALRGDARLASARARIGL